MRKVYIAFISLCLTAPALHAQEITRLTLQECMDYAAKHNYANKNAQLDILIQQTQNNQVLANAYPHVNGKADLTHFPKPQSSFIDAGTFTGGPSFIAPVPFTIPYTASASVSASMPLFDGSLLVAVKARNTVLDLVRQSGKVTDQTLRYNVMKAYNSLVIAYRQYDILKNSLEYARSLEHDVQVTREAGFAEKIDVDRTTVQVNNLASDSIRIGNMLVLTEQVLKFQMGMDINTRIMLTDTNVEAHRASAASLLAREGSYEKVPEYILVNTQLRLNEYNLQRYKLSGLPSLSAFGAIGANYGSAKFSEMTKFNKYKDYSTVGLMLNVPIFNGFMRTNQVKEAQLNIEKSKNNIENLKMVIDFQSAQARSSLKNALIQVQTELRNLDLSNEVLDLSRRKYKAGVGSNLEVTQAQTDLLRSQSNYFTSLLDIVNAEADLKKALGELSE